MMSRATDAPRSRSRRESDSAAVFPGVKSMMKKCGPAIGTAIPCVSIASSMRPMSKAKPVAGHS
ncbi:MAG: hypothetical protein DMD82_14640 [Candidatus Rokuibacteriota bacterium]|nr:MAG: hypothetical protein DMD82_14640 [Candidatus Rokubacteria bacterium]